MEATKPAEPLSLLAKALSNIEAAAEMKVVGAAEAAGPCGSGTSGPPDKKLKIAMPPTNTITVVYGKRRLRVVGASLIPVAR